MKNSLFIIAVALLLFGNVQDARAVMHAFYDESQYLSYAGSAQSEGFDTIPIDSWIYDTRLPAYIPALDLVDDPTDPNDGPKYDTDGHFDVTGHNVAYAPADELFKIYDYSPPPSPGNKNFLSFSPWYNVLWPTSYDPNNEHPIITIDNFNNSSDSINSFGLYFRPSGASWITFEFGSAGYVNLDPTKFSTNQWSFFGVISDTAFDEVVLHTNQNGSSIRIDSLAYSADGVLPGSTVPEPASLLLFSAGFVGVWVSKRRS